MVMNIDSTVDCNNTAAIHQKRTLAFVNHFVMKTVQFMNNFSSECENKLMDFELKMQKVEASLLILESKLSSIPNLEDVVEKNVDISIPNTTTATNENIADTDVQQDSTNETAEVTVDIDPRYEKLFKMIRVGVSVEGVRLKAIQEGLDPSILK